MIEKLCKWCGSNKHTQFYCFQKPKKPIKTTNRIKRFGKGSAVYKVWRETVAIPYLDKRYGHQCKRCGATENLDVDHIKNRGSHPELKMSVMNIQYLCRNCHQIKTDRLEI